MPLFRQINDNRFKLVEADLKKFVELIQTNEVTRKKQAIEKASMDKPYFFKLYLNKQNKPSDLKRINSWYIDNKFKTQKDWLTANFPDWEKHADAEIEAHVATLDLSDEVLDKEYVRHNGILNWPKGSGYDWAKFYDPVWAHFSFKAILPENTWLVHFAPDKVVKDILTGGFDKLVTEPIYLGFTAANAEKNLGTKFSRGKDGYGFAFAAEKIKELNKPGEGDQVYGQGSINHAIMFQSAGVLTYHRLDKANEVVFSGPDAKNLVAISIGPHGDWYGVKTIDPTAAGESNLFKTTDSDYAFESKTIKEAIEWVEKNFNKYKSFISVR